MQILYLAGRELEYPRNDVLLRAFRRFAQVTIVGDNRGGSTFLRSLAFSLRAGIHLRSNRYDLIFVGFYGHLMMLPIGLLANRPVLFDAFISTYDTLCFDRRIFTPRSLPGRLAFELDRSSCHLASQILVDTSLQVEYFSRTFGLDARSLHSLPVGCNEDLFRPQLPILSDHHHYTQILYYCTFQPLHGVEIVVRTAALLASESRLRFKLIGTGPEYSRIRALAEQLHVQNLSFVDSVPLADVPAEIAAATICLGGPFGSTGKASRVIPGKIYQILAMGRPLLAADTAANRELLTHDETAYLCPPADPHALASAILELHTDAGRRERLAERGRTLYLEQCSESVITEHLRQLTYEMTEKSS